MNWIIDNAKMTDAEVITDFQLLMAEESEGTTLDRETVLKGVTAGIEDPAKGLYFVARTPEGEAAGSLFLTKEWSDWNNCSYWWIQSVYVRPEFRRQGAFSSLYAEVRRLGKAEGTTCLRLYVDRENVSAQECYHKQGMAECHYLMYEETL